MAQRGLSVAQKRIFLRNRTHTFSAPAPLNLSARCRDVDYASTRGARSRRRQRRAHGHRRVGLGAVLYLYERTACRAAKREGCAAAWPSCVTILHMTREFAAAPAPSILMLVGNLKVSDSAMEMSMSVVLPSSSVMARSARDLSPPGSFARGSMRDRRAAVGARAAVAEAALELRLGANFPAKWKILQRLSPLA